MKKESFLAYFVRIPNSCVVQQVLNCQSWVSAIAAAPHTFSTRLLFNETFAQLDVFAVVNWPVVALSVFYFTVLMLCVIFLQL